MIEFCVHEKHGGICEKTGTYCNLGACPYESLKELTVVRHRRWVNISTEGGLRCKCSECGHLVSYFYGQTPFCPNCGARMDGKAV